MNQRPQTETLSAYGMTSGSAQMADVNRFVKAPYETSASPGCQVKATDVHDLRNPGVHTSFHNCSMAMVSSTYKLLQKLSGCESTIYQ